jgi:hypothetical protein
MDIIEANPIVENENKSKQWDCTLIVNTSGKAGAQIPHLPLGDDSSPLGDNTVGR